MHPSDTIAAIATARGAAALAIVRLCGEEARAVAARCFQGRDLCSVASHTAHAGTWKSPGGQVIDQVVATVFVGPHTATGEDLVEVACHGGEYVAGLILDSMTACGARLAQPGEFTQRAFVNGKLDLAQAEAVADLIHAHSALAHRTSVNALEGHYSKVLEDIRTSIIELCALAELEIDFSDEDVEFADRRQLRTLMDTALEHIAALVSSAELGRYVREGVRTVIAGQPNAGKSTLLNSLVGRDRAIVSATPGTTRDTIEADTELGAVRFRFIDTAGLRSAQDGIEQEGVRRARETMARADVVLYVYDVSKGYTRADRRAVEALGEGAVIRVGNKLDLVPTATDPDAVLISAIGGPEAVGAVRAALREHVSAHLADLGPSRMVMNVRHKAHLEAAAAALERSRRALGSKMSPDVFTLDLRAAARELGMITGAITNETVLGAIFSRFCIGK